MTALQSDLAIQLAALLEHLPGPGVLLAIGEQGGVGQARLEQLYGPQPLLFICLSGEARLPIGAFLLLLRPRLGLLASGGLAIPLTLRVLTARGH